MRVGPYSVVVTQTPSNKEQEVLSTSGGKKKQTLRQAKHSLPLLCHGFNTHTNEHCISSTRVWSRDKYQSHFYLILKSLPTACTLRHNSPHPLESAYESNFTLKLKTNTDSVERHATPHRSSGGDGLHSAAHDLHVRISQSQECITCHPKQTHSLTQHESVLRLSCRGGFNYFILFYEYPSLFTLYLLQYYYF